MISRSLTTAGAFTYRPMQSEKAFCLHSGIIPSDYDFGVSNLHVTTWNYQQTHFVTSVLIFATFPDTGIEVAFAGRSNAGKSSALNTLTNQKSLARTQKHPAVPS